MFRTAPIFVIVKYLSTGCSNNEEKGGQQQISVWQISKMLVSAIIIPFQSIHSLILAKSLTNTFHLYSNL